MPCSYALLNLIDYLRIEVRTGRTRKENSKHPEWRQWRFDRPSNWTTTPQSTTIAKTEEPFSASLKILWYQRIMWVTREDPLDELLSSVNLNALHLCLTNWRRVLFVPPSDTLSQAAFSQLPQIWASLGRSEGQMAPVAATVSSHLEGVSDSARERELYK